jgi:hypothetical protein
MVGQSRNDANSKSDSWMSEDHIIVANKTNGKEYFSVGYRYFSNAFFVTYIALALNFQSDKLEAHCCKVNNIIYINV